VIAEPLSVRVPQLNVNDDQVKIISWLVACGDRVDKSQPLVVLETSKTTTEVEAPEAGFVHYTLQADEDVAVGDILCHISAAAKLEGQTAQRPSVVQDNLPARLIGNANGELAMVPEKEEDRSGRSDAPPQLETMPEAARAGESRFSARAKARLEALGLAPEIFSGKGLVREQDVLRLANGPSPSGAGVKVVEPALSIPEAKPAEGVPVRFEPLSRQKILEAKFLASSYFHALSSSVTVSCPTRGLRQAVAGQAGLRGNATALILFETARLLRRFPIFNAFCASGRVGYYERVNLGLAVDAGRGLKVVVLQDADKKSCPAIATEIGELISQYLEDRLPVQALSGCTFTLTDLSGEGVHSFLPLINQGQSAILGIGGELPASGHGPSAFNLMLSFDHRLAEGRTAAQFLNALRERLSCHEASLAGGEDAGRPELSCSRCLRSADQLKALDGYLLSCVSPQGYLCSFCLAGF
jgi:pyruvate/2-oxoglutarate dehydrogenase complex dihydrolipoamide acyltransferase (E2) component